MKIMVKSFYLQADFTPTVGGASGEPRNEPLRSTSNVDLNVLPELFVNTWPFNICSSNKC